MILSIHHRGHRLSAAQACKGRAHDDVNGVAGVFLQMRYSQFSHQPQELSQNQQPFSVWLSAKKRVAVHEISVFRCHFSTNGGCQN